VQFTSRDKEPSAHSSDKARFLPTAEVKTLEPKVAALPPLYEAAAEKQADKF